MRLFIFFSVVILLVACNQPKPTGNLDNGAIQKQVEDIANKYKPGLGEYMLGIQLHHNKLWFAAINNNWPLANYEIGEMKESFESIKQVEIDRPEVKSIGMIEPALDSLSAAIDKKDAAGFKRNFETLTNTCNNCHVANKFEFNVITIPTAPAVTNQDFKPRVAK